MTSRTRAALLGTGVMIALSAYGCATRQEVAEVRKDVAEVRAANAALHDSLMVLWRATDKVFMAVARIDTVPPPRCPPFCWEAIVQDFPHAP